MIKTDLYTAEAVAASTGGTLTPVELQLGGDTKKFSIELSIVTTRVAVQASRKEFTLCWATTSENLNPAVDNVPQILMECTHRVPMILSELQSKQKKQIFERCLAGEYLYVWLEYPQSADAYAVTISVVEYGFASAGGSASAPAHVVGVGRSDEASFTRPNDTNPYSANDVVCNSTSAPAVLTFEDVGPSAGGEVWITAVGLRLDVAAIPAGMTRFRLHLYNAAPTPINDNAAYNLPSGDRAKYLGFVDLPDPVDNGDTLWTCTEELYYHIRKQVTLVSGNMYGILMTIGAFTPTASAVKTVSVHTQES